MKSKLVFSLYDKNGEMFELLFKAQDIIERSFESVIIGISKETEDKFKKEISKLENNSNFDIYLYVKNFTIGENLDFTLKYASRNYPDDTVLQICAVDRLFYALLSEYRDEFISDTHLAIGESKPTLFLRSKKAWTTHPKNYYACESIMTQVGKVLFDKELDFAWCHLTIKNKELKTVLKNLNQKGMLYYAQLVYLLRNKIKVKKVDWLAWEDPFFLKKDTVKYKKEREDSEEEDKKRLSYAIPIIKFLLQESKRKNLKH